MLLQWFILLHQNPESVVTVVELYLNYIAAKLNASTLAIHMLGQWHRIQCKQIGVKCRYSHDYTVTLVWCNIVHVVGRPVLSRIAAVYCTSTRYPAGVTVGYTSCNICHNHHVLVHAVPIQATMYALKGNLASNNILYIMHACHTAKRRHYLSWQPHQPPRINLS